MEPTSRKPRLLDHLSFWHAFFTPRRRLVQLVLSMDEAPARELDEQLEREIGDRVARAKMDQNGAINAERQCNNSGKAENAH